MSSPLVKLDKEGDFACEFAKTASEQILTATILSYIYSHVNIKFYLFPADLSI